MELYKRIKKYRLSLKLSQEELADQIYVTRQSISNWETNKNYPDIHSLLLMSSLFHISLDELIKGDIEKMKEEIKADDIRKFNKQSRIFTILLVGVVLSLAPLVYFFELIGVIFWLPLVIITFFYAVKVEKVKKQHDIQTYKEVVAFTQGKRLDEVVKQQEIGKRHYQTFLSALIAGVLGFVVAYAIMKVLYGLF